MSEIKKIIGERLRRRRNELKLNQEQVGEKANLHSTYIGQLERGEKNATLESIEKVAIALDLSFESLFQNIVTGEECFPLSNKYLNLLRSLSIEQQESLLKIIESIIEYKLK